MQQKLTVEIIFKTIINKIEQDSPITFSVSVLMLSYGIAVGCRYPFLLSESFELFAQKLSFVFFGSLAAEVKITISDFATVSALFLIKQKGINI